MVAISFRENYEPSKSNNTKMRGNDRVFQLEKVDPKAPDVGIFNIKNQLHAIRDESSHNLWYFKYSHGELPEELKGCFFTKFDGAVEFLTKYFNTRNIRIKEVLD